MKHQLPPARKHTSGITLVIALVLLVLLSGIVVAFLSSVRTDLVSSKTYEDSTYARLLADSAVNLVIGQIREASTQPKQAWISQPGLIRTYDTSGEAVKAYKLYSATSMVVDGAFDPAADGGDLPPTASPTSPDYWSKRTALWTDLNAPVMDRAVTPPRGTYPIFDGNDLKKSSSGAAIIDADGDGVADVEGFRIEADLDEAAKMPVRWLYVLKDGTMVPTTATNNSGEARLVIPSGKEKDAHGDPNTVVARVAFWTDDESSKINVNTASEGTFSDTPFCDSQPGISAPWSSYVTRPDTTFEWDLAERLGAQKEYQRYPGHPATTCLSPVLWSSLAQAYKLDPTKPDDRKTLLELIYLLTPRVTGYQGPVPPSSIGDLINPVNNMSSQGGTRRAGPMGVFTDTSFKITPDSDRLYAMIDELLFDPQRTVNHFGLSPANSEISTSRAVLERSKFFLTAHSMSPEQNLYNQPRVAIWPLHIAASRRTALDQLIGFCATVGRGNDAKPFYFTRQDPLSSTTDLSVRNKQIYDYLVRLTSGSFPGYKATGTFASKYGQDKDQILTEIFDYIRCTNLVDSSDYTKAYTQVGYTVPTNRDGMSGPNITNTSRGEVIPIEMSNGTRGIGRIATISELAMVVLSKGRPSSGAADANKTRLEFSLLPQLFSPMAGYSAMANNLKITFGKPNPAKAGEGIDIVVTDAKGVTYRPFDTPFAPGASSQPVQSYLYDRGRLSNVRDADSKIGGHIGSRSLVDNATEGDVPAGFASAGAPADSVPPTGEIDLDGKPDGLSANSGTVPKLKVSGSVQVNIYAPYTATTPIQTFTFTFPETNIPMPNRVADYNNQSTTPPGTASPMGEISYYSGGKWTRRNRFAPNTPVDPFVTTRDPASKYYDVIRSLVPVGKNVQGDMRIVAARKDAGDLFGTVAGYANSPTTPGIHSLRSSWRRISKAADFGSLVDFGSALTKNPTAANVEAPTKSAYAVNPTEADTVNNLQDTRPPIPEGINGVRNSLGYPGDWDNGPAQIFDGPLCNKADEGTDRHHHVSNGFGSTLYQEAAPYIGSWYEGEDGGLVYSTFFSPNRQLPSAVMFGSLPTGVKRGLPWQTLLFRPAKAYLPGGVNHPGGPQSGPPDHLLLDLFWMPVVEPYAISEPFATAGKINLNYQIAPFTYIKRDTGLRGVLKSVKIGALNPAQKTSNNTNFVEDYKITGTMGANAGGATGYREGGGRGVVIRRDIDLDNTLKQIEDRFKAASADSTTGKGNRPFISASEICEIPLIPKDVPMVAGLPMRPHVSAGFTANTKLSEFDAKLDAFWKQHTLTGDNTLERPYALIYPRLTTRSNTYTVHVRVQTLKKVPTGDKWVFKEGRDQVTGEFRGSFLIERYLDPNTAGFVDVNGKPTSDTDPDAALGPYRFRVVSSKQFAP